MRYCERQYVHVFSMMISEPVGRGSAIIGDSNAEGLVGLVILIPDSGDKDPAGRSAGGELHGLPSSINAVRERSAHKSINMRRNY